MPKLLTMPEVSERTRTPIDTLRYWRHLGTGPASFKVGRRVMYAEEDVNRWIEDQRAVGAAGRAAS